MEYQLIFYLLTNQTDISQSVHPENIKKYTKDLCCSIQRSNAEEQRLIRDMENTVENTKIIQQLKVCKILQEKQQKRLEQIAQTSGILIPELLKEIEQEKGKTITRADEKAIIAKIQSPSAVKARKALGITVLEARTIYNRLNTQTLCDLVECFKEFANESQVVELESILSVCCCSNKKAKEIIFVLSKMIEDASKTLDVKDKTVEEIDAFFEKANITAEDVKVIYLYLPYLTTSLIDESEQSEKVRELLGLSLDEVTFISEITNARNVLELLDHYRHNKESRKWGLFSPEQVKALHAEYGLPMEKTLRLIQTIGTMSHEAQFVPPAFFAFVTGSLDPTMRELDLAAFGDSEAVPCAALSGLFAYISQRNIPIEKLILERSGINEDKAVCIKLLLESGHVPVTYLNLSLNNLTDRAVELVLSGAKSNSNPNGKLEVLLLDENSLLPQTGVRIAHALSSTGKSQMVALKILSLTYNKLGDIAVESIARVIEKGATVLQYLDLSYNEFGDSGLIALSNGIMNSKNKVHSLMMVGNEFFDEGVRHLTKVLANPSKDSKLKILKIGTLECTEDAFTDFLLEGVGRCKSLNYMYVIAPYIECLALDKANTGTVYKKVVCTDMVDIKCYNKNLLHIICDSLRSEQGRTFEQLLLDKIVAEKAKSLNTLETLIYAVSQHLLPLNKPLRNGLSLIHVLAESNYAEGVDYLLRIGVSPLFPTSIGNKAFPYATVTHIAAFYGHLEVLRRVLWYVNQPNSASADEVLQATDLHGNTPLHYAAKEGRLEICVELCETAPELVAAKNKLRNLPLHAAIIKDQRNTFEYLSKSAAEPVHELWENVRGEGGACCAVLAAKYGSLRIFEYLIHNKARMDVKDDKLRTPLHWAIECKNGQEIALCLIKSKLVPVDTEDENGETPAFYAVKKGMYTILIELDNAGANLNKFDKKNNTLLHYAAKVDRADIIGYLIEKGVSPLTRNKDLFYPQDLALKPHIKKMLTLNLSNTSSSPSEKGVIMPPANTTAYGSTGSRLEIFKHAHNDATVYGTSLEDLPLKTTFSGKSALGRFLAEENYEEQKSRPNTILGVFVDEEESLPRRLTRTDNNTVRSGYNTKQGFKLETTSLYTIPQEDADQQKLTYIKPMLFRFLTLYLVQAYKRTRKNCCIFLSFSVQLPCCFLFQLPSFLSVKCLQKLREGMLCLSQLPMDKLSQHIALSRTGLDLFGYFQTQCTAKGTRKSGLALSIMEQYILLSAASPRYFLIGHINPYNAKYVPMRLTPIPTYTITAYSPALSQASETVKMFQNMQNAEKTAMYKKVMELAQRNRTNCFMFRSPMQLFTKPQ
eukprot:TRINITY_DN105222_c0_g1_i1.p1 TRINITY_DN105222_c0_g1~~TRINITY_DN105222_c0_g1_i1.p1  ORF type:complete len:1327 (+),score=97.89 TRINITY_DN105222_c0_g1_i1:4305-8285(+)